MERVWSFYEWLHERTSAEIFQPTRNRPVKFNARQYPELADEFFGLINTAYHEIGGHAKVKSPTDVFADPNWNFWVGTDIHGDENFDIIIFGQKTKYGVKFSGVGHDGSNQAKRTYISAQAEDLRKLGYYVEVSGKIADILISKYDCPIITSHADVERVLGKRVEWVGENPDDKSSPGNAWYLRKIGGHDHAKIMLGRPRV